MILANTENNTVKEISRKAGIKEEAVYHLLEFLVIAGIVKKENDRYDVDSIIRNIAELLLNVKNLESVNEAIKKYTLAGRVVRFISNVLGTDEKSFLEFNVVK